MKIAFNRKIVATEVDASGEFVTVTLGEKELPDEKEGEPEEFFAQEMHCEVCGEFLGWAPYYRTEYRCDRCRKEPFIK